MSPSVILSTAAQGSDKSLPDQSSLESGDLLWPKKPDSFIPYNAGSPNSPDEVREQWETERAAFIRSISQLPETDYNKRLVASIRDLSFDEFQTYYTTGLAPGTPAPAGNQVGVGHVAIVYRRTNSIDIIEAMPDPGVRCLGYDKWLAGRPEEKVWHARLRNFDKVQRAKIPEEAIRFLNRPYEFWNFKLDDDSGFYCSKLVWLSTRRALDFAIDGDTNPNRTLWVSPKQLLNTTAVEPLFVPDVY